MPPSHPSTDIALDSGARAYHALIVSHHKHNNPLMRCFVWILQEDAAKRRLRTPGMASPAMRRVGNCFHKLWVMHKTRSLADYSASGTHISMDLVHKAARKKDVGLLQVELSAVKLEVQRAPCSPVALQEPCIPPSRLRHR